MYDVRSVVSQLAHLAVFRIEKARGHFDKAMLVMSIDVDVGDRRLGVENAGRNDRNVNDYLSEFEIGRIEEEAFPLILQELNRFEAPATFALRGQAIEYSDMIRALQESPVKHDIGAHGYSHRKFTDLTLNDADVELRMISEGMKEHGIVPKSFVFPRNRVSHLGLLKQYGYECFRSRGGLTRDGMQIQKKEGLHDVRPSIYVDQSSMLLREMLDIAVSKKLVFHMWFHLWSFGQGLQMQKNIQRVLVSLLEYAKPLERSGILTFETMFSAAKKSESRRSTNQ